MGVLFLLAIPKIAKKNPHPPWGVWRETPVVARIQDANQTQMRILEDIPSQLRHLWGQCLTCVLDSFPSAKTDKDTYKALEAWAKLKVVLILPTRCGRKRGNPVCVATALCYNE